MTTKGSEPFSLSAQSANRWLDRFFVYWRTADAAGGSELFTIDAVFTESVYEERWPQGKRMHGRAEIAEYWQHVTEGWPFIQGGHELWATDADVAYGRLWADLRWPAEGCWLPLNHVFEAAFVPNDDGEPRCRFWREWKPDAPERLWHREPHPLHQP